MYRSTSSITVFAQLLPFLETLRNAPAFRAWITWWAESGDEAAHAVLLRAMADMERLTRT